MLLEIQVGPRDVIFSKEGRMIVKVSKPGYLIQVATIVTKNGGSLTDFVKEDVKSRKNIFVGVNGGISF